MTVIVTAALERQIRNLPRTDRRELRNFVRFLKLKDAGRLFEMVQRPRWQKYLYLTPGQVQAAMDKDQAAFKRFLEKM